MKGPESSINLAPVKSSGMIGGSGAAAFLRSFAMSPTA